MSMDSDLVSVVIPCRNEEGFIAGCLDSILAQDYPNEKFEILVIDGISTDKTAEIIKYYARKDSRIRYLENSKQITPCALNIGINNSRGNFVLWMSAHNRYEKSHISKCIRYIKDFDADAAGGIIKPRSRNDSLIGRAICLALSSPFGVGSSLHKTGSLKRPRWADTAFGTCYKKEVFDKVGVFNENLVRGQDMEFALRLKKAGLRTLLAPDIVSYYYPRSDYLSFIRHNFSNGFWAIYPFKFTSHMPVSLRHLVPLGFVLTLVLSLTLYRPLFLAVLALYCLTNLYFSSIIAYKQKDAHYLFITPVIFFSLHFSYGLGSLAGLLRLIFGGFSRRDYGIKKA